MTLCAEMSSARGDFGTGVRLKAKSSHILPCSLTIKRRHAGAGVGIVVRVARHLDTFPRHSRHDWLSATGGRTNRTIAATAISAQNMHSSSESSQKLTQARHIMPHTAMLWLASVWPRYFPCSDCCPHLPFRASRTYL